MPVIESTLSKATYGGGVRDVQRIRMMYIRPLDIASVQQLRSLHLTRYLQGCPRAS